MSRPLRRNKRGHCDHKSNTSTLRCSTWLFYWLSLFLQIMHLQKRKKDGWSFWKFIVFRKFLDFEGLHFSNLDSEKTFRDGCFFYVQSEIYLRISFYYYFKKITIKKNNNILTTYLVEIEHVNCNSSSFVFSKKMFRPEDDVSSESTSNRKVLP